MAIGSAKDAAIAFDRSGVTAAEKGIVPGINWLIKNVANAVLRIVDRFRNNKENEDLEDTDLDVPVQNFYGDFERQLDSMSPGAKVLSYRFVYMLSLLSVLYGGGKMIIGEEDSQPPMDDVGQGLFIDDDFSTGLSEFFDVKEEPSLMSVKNSILVSIYQPGDEDEFESGTLSYYQTINEFLNDFINGGVEFSGVTSYELYAVDGSNVTTMTVDIRDRKVFIDGEEFDFRYSHSHKAIFFRSFLKKTVGYRVVKDGVVNVGFKPQEDPEELNKIMAQVLDEPDVAMVHFRGHTGFGAEFALSEDIINPAVVNLGGCYSLDYLDTAEREHVGRVISALSAGTDWTVNHNRVRRLMEVLRGFKGKQVAYSEFEKALVKDYPDFFELGVISYPDSTREE